MRVLLAPDCFTGTLTATQAAEAMRGRLGRAGAARPARHLPAVRRRPRLRRHPRRHPRRRRSRRSPSPARSARRCRPSCCGVGRTTAYVETAQACGLHLVPADRRDPGATTTAGVGELVAAAVDGGATRVVLGLGGSGTNDGGAGMLAALGAGDPAGCWPAAASGSPTSPPDALTPARRPPPARAAPGWSWPTDVDVPLLGLQGASAGFAAQKGATPEQAQRLEAALGHFADLAVRAAGRRRAPDLLLGAGTSAGARRRLTAGARRRCRRRPRVRPDAARGHRVPGSAAVLDAVGFDALLADTDLVVTGEGSFDWQSLRGKVVSAVAERGARGRASPRSWWRAGSRPGAARPPRPGSSRPTRSPRPTRSSRPRWPTRAARSRPGATGRAHLVAATALSTSRRRPRGSPPVRARSGAGTAYRGGGGTTGGPGRLTTTSTDGARWSSAGAAPETKRAR